MNHYQAFLFNQPSMQELIVANPTVMMGKPVIKGTHITVEHILDKLASGLTYQELLEAYPNLTNESIQAALKFAADSIRHQAVQQYRQALHMAPHEALERLRQLRSSLPQVDVVEIMRASRNELEQRGLF